MKKFLSIVLSILMVASLSFSAFAASSEAVVKTTSGKFGITEMIDKNHRVIRTFKRDEVNNNIQARLGKIDYSETKAMLLELGMEQDFIDKLSLDALETYRSSKQLIGITSYTKSDADHNVEYVEEDVALAASAIINEAQQERIKLLANGDKVVQTRAQDTYEDSYMRVFYLVTHLGDGEYKYSTDARWLTMPMFRGKDSIGSCAQNGTVTPGTQYGWYEYDVTHTNFGRITYSYYNADISSSNYKNAVNGNWYGSAAIIDLPNDIFADYTNTVYTNYKVHFEYTGYVNYPELVSHFNTSGTYLHSTLHIELTAPSVSLNIFGNGSASIGIRVTGFKEIRSVELAITYRP